MAPQDAFHNAGTASGPETATAEGDTNTSRGRRHWRSGLDARTRSALAADEQVFLHQSLSTPCLDVVEQASGATLTLLDGRKLLDFHGNSVHQVGYGHPQVLAAI